MSGGAAWGGAGSVLAGLFFIGAGAAFMNGEGEVEERYAPFVDGPTVQAQVLGRGSADDRIRVSYTDPSGTRNVSEVEAPPTTPAPTRQGEAVEVVLSRTDPSRAVTRRRLADAALVVLGPIQTTVLTAVGLGLILMGIGVVGTAFSTSASGGDGRRYRIPGTLRWLWFWGGLSALCIGVAFAVPWVGADTDRDAFEVGVAVFGVLMLAAGVGCLAILVRMGRHTVFLSRDGLRMGGSSRRVPWSEVARFRERPLLQRMDLLDREGRRVGMIDYHLAGVEELLEVVGARVRNARVAGPAEEADYPRQFGNRNRQIALTLGGGLVTALFVAVGNAPGIGILMGLGVMVVGLIRWGDRDVLRLELADDALLVSTMVTTRRIAREDVLDVESDLEGDRQGMALSTVVVVPDGRMPVTPVGCDAMEVHEALSRWKEEADDGVYRVLLATLVDAMRCIDPECFRITISQHERAPIRERLYRYELYHLLRALTVERQILGGLLFHGDAELGTAHVSDAPHGSRPPDLLVHRPGTDVVNGRMTVCEVELAPVSKSELRAATGALRDCIAQGYYRAVLVVVGGDEKHAVRVAAAAYRLFRPPARALTVLWHDRAGSVRTLPDPEEPDGKVRHASSRAVPGQREAGRNPPTRPARSIPFPEPGAPASAPPDLPRGVHLRDQVQERPEFVDVLLDAAAEMDAGYFRRSLAPGPHRNLRERHYRYELYHLLRLRMPRRPLLRRFSLHGEVHPGPDEFIRRKVGSLNPDFLVHQAGNTWKFGGSLAVVEVELSPVAAARAKRAVETLRTFRDAGYFTAILIVVGGEEVHVQEAVRPAYEDTELLAWLERFRVIWHRRPGEALVLPRPPDVEERLRRARARWRSKRQGQGELDSEE